MGYSKSTISTGAHLLDLPQEMNAKSHVLVCIGVHYKSNRFSNENLFILDLMTNDITKAVNCANKVFARHGYNAWYGWKSKCSKGVKDLSYCM